MVSVVISRAVSAALEVAAVHNCGGFALSTLVALHICSSLC